LKRIAILHYAGPPGIGGVESTMAHHARALTNLGYRVRIISGTATSGATGEPIEYMTNPLFSSNSPPVLAVKSELDRGELTPNFTHLLNEISHSLRSALAECDVCIAHNILTFNKNLPLTTALAAFHAEERIRLIGWCHDLAWMNTQYQPELYDHYPWTLLRSPWPNAVYATVSEPRRHELAQMLNVPLEKVSVVVPGVDPERFLQWTPVMRDIQSRLQLLDAAGLLLLPARITRRKNIALGIRTLAALRQQTGRDFRLIVTGPPGPHNPANAAYLTELTQISQECDVAPFVHFLYTLGTQDNPLFIDDTTLANLFQLADILFFPSLQEGFGIPLLEAGLTALPIFCADIPVLHMTGQEDIHYFDPLHDAPETIAARIQSFLNDNVAYRLRLRVRKHYRWDVIVREQVVPLVEA
jgi:glycosyltransferase involved in cell wall biosynthesis